MKFLATCIVVFTLGLLGVCPAIAEPPLFSGKDKPNTGEPTVALWPRLTDSEQATAVAGLKEYAVDTAARLDFPLRMFETKFFLFYSDLPEQESARWAGLLDKMYDRLSELFGVQKGENIWRGKALIFVFSKEESYQKYEREILHTDPGMTEGMCHSSPNGFVRIAFFRRSDDTRFAHVLVHESVHGFVHRFRTPVVVPNWANEGLAETIATELVPQKSGRDQIKISARSWLKLHENRVGDLFTLVHIEGWQYPVAEMLCTYMIQSNKQKYVAFIRGLKDGIPYEQALKTEYGVSLDHLLASFGQSIGIRNLR